MMDTINTPVSAPMNQVPTPPIKYAGFWVRFVAYVVDSLVLFIPNIIIISLISIFSAVMFGQAAGRVLGYIAEVLIVWVYFVLMTYYVGATLGKMLVGIRVQSDSVGKLSFGRVIIRETIGKLVSSIILLIGYIIAGFTDRKRALHDMFAHSVVVYKNPAKPHGVGLVIGIIIATILPIIAIFVILSSIVLVLLSTARQLGVAQNKGQDARVMTLISSMRASAEIYYGNNNNSYSIAKDCSSGMFADSNIQSSLSSLVNNTPTCYAEGTSYAVSAPLTTSGSHFCVDSTGKAGNGVAIDTGSNASCRLTGQI